MGVRACDRRGCENIMCDHTILSEFYICLDCIQELNAAFCSYKPESESEAKVKIRAFMDIEVETFKMDKSFEDVLNLRNVYDD